MATPIAQVSKVDLKNLTVKYCNRHCTPASGFLFTIEKGEIVNEIYNNSGCEELKSVGNSILRFL